MLLLVVVVCQHHNDFFLNAKSLTSCFNNYVVKKVPIRRVDSVGSTCLLALLLEEGGGTIGLLNL